jgi:VanZ family protein
VPPDVTIGPRLRVAAGFVALLGVLVVAIASTVPNLIFVQQPILDLLARKAGHVVIFFVIVLTAGIALEGFMPARAVAALLMVGTLAIALVDERNQAQVMGRQASPIDIALDLVGGIAGALAYLWLSRRGLSRS